MNEKIYLERQKRIYILEQEEHLIEIISQLDVNQVHPVFCYRNC